MSGEGYYRFPAIWRDRIVFISEDNLFEVDRQGGVARQLTSGFGRCTRPVLSSDGQWLAFAGHEEGDQEIYVIPAQGGEVRRLTYLGGRAVPIAFDEQNRVMFLSAHAQPFIRQNRVYRVAVQGGDPELLPLGHANSAAFSPSGGVVLNWWARDPADWKRYRGGWRGVLWIDQNGSGEFNRFAFEHGNISSPMWVGRRIYFLSDHEGIGNLYSIDPSKEDVTRHTNHRDFYARNAQTDGRHIVYHAGGDLYVYDSQTGEAAKVRVTYSSQRRQRQPKHVDAGEYLTEYALSPTGDELMVVSRGKLFRLRPFDGPVRQLGEPQGVRYRQVRWFGSNTLLCVSDAGGEDGIEIHRYQADGSIEVRRINGNFGLTKEVEVSPDGLYAGISNERLEVWLIDLSRETSEIIATSEYADVQGLAFSPDSRWLCYALPITREQTALFLYDLVNKTSTQVTEPVLTDRDPVFDPAGQYLYFISKRTFSPVNDAIRNDRAFIEVEKVYALVLTKEARSPFCPMAEDRYPVPIDVDLDNIRERIVEFPMDATDIVQLAAGSGAVYWTERSNPIAPLTLHLYRIDDLEHEALGQVTSFHLSQDGRVMALLGQENLRVLKAGDQCEESGDEYPGRESGIVDLHRIRLTVVPEMEWRQMVRESWRLLRALFWTKDMSGVDWNAVYRKYHKLVPRLSSRSELSDLLWEMHGELGTSHAFEMEGDYYADPAHPIGFLGADYRWNGERSGYEIVDMVKGDLWSQGRHSPLLDPGNNIEHGDVIIAIDGESLTAKIPPGARLVNKQEQDVVLTIVPKDGGDVRQVVVRTLKDETPARYRQWVEQNRQMVHERTAGRVGYVHIPDMQNSGFAEFHRGFLQELGRDGLIVDVRFNSGGLVGSLLLEDLSRPRLGYMVPRHGKVGTHFRESGPVRMVALINESTGSDGDAFSHCWKMLGLGPLIGTRTWGGVVGNSAQFRLVDGTLTMQPSVALWFNDVEWDVENYGTVPTIEVHNRPQDQARGYDAQMERALYEIKRILTEDPPRIPEFDNRPSKAFKAESY